MPRPCEDCGAIDQPPGIFHACPGRPVDAALAAALAFRRADQVAPIIVAELERSGLDPTRTRRPTIVRHDDSPSAVVSSDVRADTNVVDLEERRLWPQLRRGKS